MSRKEGEKKRKTVEGGRKKIESFIFRYLFSIPWQGNIREKRERRKKTKKMKKGGKGEQLLPPLIPRTGGTPKKGGSLEEKWGRGGGKKEKGKKEAGFSTICIASRHKKS